MKIWIFLLMFASASSFGDVKHSVGSGFQHALIGYQIALDEGGNRFYTSLGLATITIGYQRFIDTGQKHSIGLNAWTTAILEAEEHVSATYNFYPKGRSVKGITLNLALGLRSASDNHEQETFVTWGIGYQF